MLYSADTPEAYLDQLDQDWRKEKLLQVREMILSQGTKLTETIAYKMLAYQFKGQTIFHLNAQRAYVSLYVGDLSKIKGSHELLHAFDKGKGCIRIKRKNNLEESSLEEFIKQTITHWYGGDDSLC